MAAPIPTQSLRSLLGRLNYSSNGTNVDFSVCSTNTNLGLINRYRRTKISAGMYPHNQN